MAELDLKFQYLNAFAHREQTCPVFLKSRGVLGSLRALKVAEINFEKVKIVFRGYLTNSIGHACSSFHEPQKLLIEQNILKLTDVQNSVSSRYDPDNGDGECFHFDFQFPTESSFLGSDEDEKSPTTFPSSLSVLGPRCMAPSGQPCCVAESKVKYVIQAWAYQGDDVVASVTEEVRIYDTADSFPPPINITDFLGEYVCQREKRLKRLLVRGRRLMISISEPKPLEIQPHDGVALAEYPIRFVMSIESNKPASEATPGVVALRINSFLKTSTYVAVGRMESRPTVCQVQQSAMLASMTKIGRRYHRKLNLSGWNHESDGTKSYWVKELTLFLPILENYCPVPSFFTPHLSRRYSVTMHMEAKGGGKARFSFNIPLQIVYPESPTYSEDTARVQPSQNLGQADEELPLYVR